ncbi:MAG: hypothetical protein JWM80_2283 [Cyanobacteria bacterium RYN_339]|nr:hypothetical protein [Cyanobacteria bacterium RYN_339]
MSIAIRPSLMLPPAPARPAVPAFKAPAVKQINEEAGSLLVSAIKEMVKQPGKTLKSFGAMLLEPFIHPGRGVARIAEVWHKDGWFSGALAALLYLSTALTTASFVVMGLAALAAPFTGGASLALIPLASTVMVWTGFHDAAVTAAILGKDEWDAVHATSQDDLDRKEAMLADDYLNTFFAWVTLPLTDAKTALTVAPQGLWMSARGAVKPAARSVLKPAARDVLKPAARSVLKPGARAVVRVSGRGSDS